jgi:hypothetical protein
MQRPRPALLFALAGSAGLAAYGFFGDDVMEIVQPAARAVAPAHAAIVRDTSPVGGTPAPSFHLGSRPAAPEQPRDLFAAYSWVPPPPPPPPPAPPAPPQAPPLPFTYGGSIEIGADVVFLLLEGPRTRQVAVGDTVGDFQLQSVTARSLVFLHLPTGLPQTLAVPGLPIAARMP